MVIDHNPPPCPTLLELLLQMADCRVLTNTNGGNVYGNNQHKKKALKEDWEKIKPRNRGRAIRIGAQL